MHKNYQLIAIGASTGGTNATESILTALQEALPPIIIFQHMPSTFTALYAERLNAKTPFVVKEGQDGDILLSGHAYVAPGGFQTEVIMQNNQLQLKIYKGASTMLHAPSVDVGFESISNLTPLCGLGIILTGMGKDGSMGLLKMRQNGFTTIGQDESTCSVYGMPRAAFLNGAVEYQLPLHQIPKKLMELVSH